MRIQVIRDNAKKTMPEGVLAVVRGRRILTARQLKMGALL